MAIDLDNSSGSSNTSDKKTAAVSFSNPKFTDNPNEKTAEYFEAMDWLMRAEPHGISRPKIVGELVRGVYEARENDNNRDFLMNATVLMCDSKDLTDLIEVIEKELEKEE